MSFLEKVLKEYRSERSLIRRLAYAPLRPSEVDLELVEYKDAQFLVLANEDLGWRMLSQHRYEEDEIDAILELIEPSDLCVDVGANLGIYSILMAQAAPEGQVIAFEPLRLHRSILAFNQTVNDVSNLEVRPTVLSNEAGRTELAVPDDGGYASIQDTDRREVQETIEVQMERLDDVAPDASSLGVLKIDVEGAEALVLEGAQEILGDRQRRPRAILVEINAENLAAFGSTPEGIEKRLRGHGYVPHHFEKDGRVEEGFSTRHTENVLFLAGDQGS